MSAIRLLWMACVSGALLSPALLAQLNDHCTVSILNRTAQVKPDGTWHIDNIPFTREVLRARSACVDGGVTRLSQSEPFNVPLSLQVGVGAEFSSATTPIPTSVRITAPVNKLTTLNQTVALKVTGTFAGNTTKDLTAAATGTTYFVSNSDLVTIGKDGVVTAKATGNVLIQAVNEGAPGLFQLSVALSGDSDGDGIPDDVEIAQGLNPENPADALEDSDHDGLSNVEEFKAGTNMKNPDSDGDGLPDGQEVKTLHTNPLLKDTDSDGVPDNIEVATASDPTNPNSFNLGAALSGIRVSPVSFSIASNPNGAFQQLTVTGDFKLGGTIDLTPVSRGTAYTSNNLQICRFTGQDGRILGAAVGSCVITVTNSTFSRTVAGAVTGSTVGPLSELTLPGNGSANSVDVLGGFAYVAAANAGLFVVNISDPAHTVITGSLVTPGAAFDVRVIGNLAYIASGQAGLVIVDVANPAAPVLLGTVDTPGDATDLFVFADRAYVSDGLTGLAIVSVANPAAPILLKQVAMPRNGRSDNRLQGVEVLHGPGNKTYVVALDRGSGQAFGESNLRVIDVTDAASASVVASLQTDTLPVELRVAGNFAYVVGFGRRPLTAFDLTNPLAPVLAGIVPEVVQTADIDVAGHFALSGRGLVDISNPAAPVFVSFLSLGPCIVTSTVLSGPFVYNSCGDSRLALPSRSATGFGGITQFEIGQYLPDQDTLGVAPGVTLLAPAGNSTVVRGSTIALHAAANDDVAVRSVTFQVNGVDVLTDNSAPYDAHFAVPLNATTLSISARATDLGNNVTTTPLITLTVAADPLTAAAGRVVAADGTPVQGAVVLCNDTRALSGTDGRFVVPGLPTITGAVGCSASVTADSKAANKTALRGAAAMEPFVGGTTSAGDIVIQP